MWTRRQRVTVSASGGWFQEGGREHLLEVGVATATALRSSLRRESIGVSPGVAPKYGTVGVGRVGTPGAFGEDRAPGITHV